MFKYVIIFINKQLNTNVLVVYLKNDMNIINDMYSKKLLDAIPVTTDIREAYIFDNFEEAKELVYIIKYHYRELLQVDIGIKRLQDKDLTLLLQAKSNQI